VRTFRSVFIAVFLGTALLVAAFLVNARRPRVEVERPNAEQVAATGRCASCHRQVSGAVVAEYERGRHAQVGTNCLDCHGPQEGQESFEHRGFTLARAVTSRNCASCHARQYTEFLRSRHAAPAYAAVAGSQAFTEEQIALSEESHPGAVRREAHPLVALEGPAATSAGCISCHQIGKPNPDGSIGNCTACHSRHMTSVELVRLPRTCGQCHMGPDHSQLEIYEESKHGVLFNAQRAEMNLKAPPQRLTVRDMPVPTCATCHMSGIGDNGVTHDVGSRLSYYLFAPISERRPTYRTGRENMMAVCTTCHTPNHVRAQFQQAEAVVAETNAKVAEANRLMDGLRGRGLLTPGGFDQPIDFIYFDFWHYYGRTSKHGAFMGGADYVQWHGNYELVKGMVELRAQAAELERGHGGAESTAGPAR
jgi:hypothetical protein